MTDTNASTGTNRPENEYLAGLFYEFADRLEATDVEYKPTAYRRAAENIADHPTAVADLAIENPAALAEIDRVGEAIASKIVEYVETGTIDELEALRADLPVDIEALTAVEGVGPKTVGALYEALGVETLDDLERAAREGEIQAVDGFGAKTEQNILEHIEFARQARQRELLGDARPLADRIVATLGEHESVEAVETAGSIRRWTPTVGDVDVLVASEDGETIVEVFTEVGGVDTVLQAGSSKASVRIRGVQIDLRVVAPDQFGSALQYFTGSKEHNVELRNYALDRDISLNEYGAYDVSALDADAAPQSGTKLAGETEESMYEVLDLAWIPPELREATGEIEAAARGDLPALLERDQIRGDLHVHSDWSDGSESLESIVEGAAAFGHEYVAITDHATGPGVVGGIGLDDDRLREELSEIRAVDDEADIDVFAGVEANIDADGAITVGDDLLAELDLVVASPHSGLGATGPQATDRLVSAIEHPEVDIIGHPSGRLLNQRSGMTVDSERVAEAAAEHDVALEVNSNPARLDLPGEDVRAAVEAGARVVINTDAHSSAEFENIRYGVRTARRGWAEPTDVLNTVSIDELRSWLA
jgi:DNA polymerase (family 10)